MEGVMYVEGILSIWEESEPFQLCYQTRVWRRNTQYDKAVLESMHTESQHIPVCKTLDLTITLTTPGVVAIDVCGGDVVLHLNHTCALRFGRRYLLRLISSYIKVFVAMFTR
jgi:hypothetical protein